MGHALIQKKMQVRRNKRDSLLRFYKWNVGFMAPKARRVRR